MLWHAEQGRRTTICVVASWLEAGTAGQTFAVTYTDMTMFGVPARIPMSSVQTPRFRRSADDRVRTVLDCT